MAKSKISDTTRRFAGRLKELRAAAGLSQADLAKASGVKQASIATYELGQSAPSLDRAAALATALGVSVDSFISQTTRKK